MNYNLPVNFQDVDNILELSWKASDVPCPKCGKQDLFYSLDEFTIIYECDNIDCGYQKEEVC